MQVPTGSRLVVVRELSCGKVSCSADAFILLAVINQQNTQRW
jgi:hypothetical protein